MGASVKWTVRCKTLIAIRASSVSHETDRARAIIATLSEADLYFEGRRGMKCADSVSSAERRFGSFDAIRDVGVDVLSVNAMISVFVRIGERQRAEALFENVNAKAVFSGAPMQRHFCFCSLCAVTAAMSKGRARCGMSLVTGTVVCCARSCCLAMAPRKCI